MPLIIINKTSVKDMKPMKVIHMDSPREAHNNLYHKVEETHTKEELDSLHRAIRYTHQFKHEESMEKMNEESPIEQMLNLPKILKDI